jgi:hypothetical protein
MGLNPHRTQSRSPWDYVFVGAALLAAALVLLWALLG